LASSSGASRSNGLVPKSDLLAQKEIKQMSKFINRFAKDESGATAIEYGLIAALISVAIVGALTALGGKLGTTFNNVAASMTPAGG
jgi:pilus assembly protein Flp/PilA